MRWVCDVSSGTSILWYMWGALVATCTRPVGFPNLQAYIAQRLPIVWVASDSVDPRTSQGSPLEGPGVCVGVMSV